MKEVKYFTGMFVGGIIASFHLVFNTEVSEHFAFIGMGVAFCSAAYYAYSLCLEKG